MSLEPLPAKTLDKSHIDPCPTEDCGTSAIDHTSPTLTGWTLVVVLGSGERGRYYCSPPCANHGIARMHRLTTRPAGE